MPPPSQNGLKTVDATHNEDLAALNWRWLRFTATRTEPKEALDLYHH